MDYRIFYVSVLMRTYTHGGLGAPTAEVGGGGGGGAIDSDFVPFPYKYPVLPLVVEAFKMSYKSSQKVSRRYVRVCVCVRACVRSFVRACMRACVCGRLFAAWFSLLLSCFLFSVARSGFVLKVRALQVLHYYY